MCGRYTDGKRDKQFLVRMGIEQAEIDFVPRYNIAPTQETSIVAQGEHGFDLRRARWGLIPFWAKDEKIGNSLIYATNGWEILSFSINPKLRQEDADNWTLLLRRPK